MGDWMQGVTEGTDSIPVPFSNGEVTGWENWARDLLEDGHGRDSSQQCRSTELRRGAHRLHSELNIRRRYLDALKDAAQFVPRDRQSWGCYPLIDTPTLRVGLISLYRFFSIPLHDHPNTYGVQKVLSGKVRIRQYQFVPDSSRNRTLVSLERVSERILGKGESSIFTPSFRNLHELEPGSSRCVVLSMMMNPYRPHDSSWYYPVPFTQSGNKGLYNRIKKQHATRVALNTKRGKQRAIPIV